MATNKAARKSRTAKHRIAPLTPDSPDPEARAMASSPKLMAILHEARERARQPGGTISQEELERRRPLTAEEHAAGETLLAGWLADDAAAGVVDPPAAGANGRAGTAARPRRSRA